MRGKYEFCVFDRFFIVSEKPKENETNIETTENEVAKDNVEDMETENANVSETESEISDEESEINDSNR